MKIIFLIGSFCLIFSGNAQYNLVPNGGFEDVPNCTELSYSITAAPPWINPTEYGTPDLYNYCNTSAEWFIDQYQQVHSGLGYAGFYSVIFDEPNQSDIREYIQVQLTDSLIMNKYYKVEYYLSLHEWTKYGTNNIGMYFSDTAIYRNGLTYDSVLLDFLPQVKPFGNPILIDTVNWMKIEGVYLAAGGEKFITIGNFNTDSETDTFSISQQLNTAENREASYYVIDDISVVPIDLIPEGFYANAGPDQTLYIQDSVFIGQKISNLNCNWYELGGGQIASNTSGLYVQPSQTTTYVVEQILGSEISYDTCTVFVEGVGLEEQAKQSIKIYPNPNNGVFTIFVEDESVNFVDVNLKDISGKILYSDKVSIENNILQMNYPVKSGIYYLEIRDSLTNNSTTEKITIVN